MRLLKLGSAIVGLLLVSGSVAIAQDLAVAVTNQSQPVLCAEKDNVAIALTGGDVARFRIEARHPAYIAMLRSDNAAPDWTECDMSADPSVAPPAPPRTVTLYDGPALRVIGFTFASFWRPADAVVQVGDRSERNLHLIQLWVPGPHGWEEVLVLYPPDGYWRARPLTPDGLTSTAYGSSFLVGPIEMQERPLVRIDTIAIDQASRTVRLRFSRGGAAAIAIAEIDRAHEALDVAFDEPIVGGPFAMLRSMYVTATNNDVARIALREPGASGWREQGIMRFDQARATELWAGRTVPSHHNTSAPDMIFRAFAGVSRSRPAQ